jgi:hypothetical protein
MLRDRGGKARHGATPGPYPSTNPKRETDMDRRLSNEMELIARGKLAGIAILIATLCLILVLT